MLTMYGLLADGIVLVHLAFVGFVVLGGLLVLRWPRVAWVHLPAAAWGAWVEFAGWACPLTPLEIRLRRLGGNAGHSSDFVEHYILPVLYPEALTRDTQWALGALVVAVNLLVYGFCLRRTIRRRRRPG
jgi:hypothetical protein